LLNVHMPNVRKKNTKIEASHINTKEECIPRRMVFIPEKILSAQKRVINMHLILIKKSFLSNTNIVDKEYEYNQEERIDSKDDNIDRKVNLEA